MLFKRTTRVRRVARPDQSTRILAVVSKYSQSGHPPKRFRDWALKCEYDHRGFATHCVPGTVIGHRVFTTLNLESILGPDDDDEPVTTTVVGLS